ncbi:MAG: hypothetical protein WCD18_26355, partial [Thermosynechococcaceae cyanobacterium]
LKAGECLIFSPGYRYRPYRLRVKRSKQDLLGRQRCIRLWHDPDNPGQGICAKLIRRQERADNPTAIIEALNEELNNRSVYADAILPSPLELEASHAG